jgi:hypothetical protein
MISKKFQYYNSGYWFMLYIGLAAAGFYTTYFARLTEPMAFTIHLHFVLMALWLAMLIAQPFLIKYKQLKWHRLVGKGSYLLVPLLVATAFLLTRNEYYRNLSHLEVAVSSGKQLLTRAEMLQRASASPVALVYTVWFVVFYVLAIVNRHNANKHARYMMATALTLTGPTVDRILGIHFGIESIGGISSFIISFLLIDLVLVWLLYLDYKHRRTTSALGISLLLYIAGQLFYFSCPFLSWWPDTIRVLMLPAPG